MKAILVREFAPGGDVNVEAVDEPIPENDEVIVGVEAAEINYPDLLMMEGNYQVKPPLPFILGKGAAGRVVALGAGVSNLQLGQRVAAQVEHGAFCERMRVRQSLCYPIPNGISAEIACASLLTYQSAWFALIDRAVFKPGETVLVLGAGGGVGIAAIHLAKALGADLVIAGTRGTSKVDLVRRAGADHVVDVSRTDVRESLRAEVYAQTEGRGVDVTIDPVGGPFFEPALRALAWRGRHIILGFAGGEIPVARTNYLLVRNITVSGLQASDYRDRWPEACAEAQSQIFSFITRGLFSPEISEVYPFHRFTEALEKLRRGEARGKILLRVGGS